MTTPESDLLNIPGDMALVMADAERAMHSILDDRQVWQEEADRKEATPLPWPLLATGSGQSQFLRWLAAGCVETVLDAMAQAAGGDRPADPDANDPDFQVVLRVVKRAVDAAEDCIKQYWLLPGRLSGWQDLKNWLKRRRMDEIVRSGAKGKRAAALAGLSVASSYRAQHRKPKSPRRKG